MLHVPESEISETRLLVQGSENVGASSSSFASSMNFFCQVLYILKLPVCISLFVIALMDILVRAICNLSACPASFSPCM